MGRDEDRFTGPRISSLASLSLLDNKAPEASQIYTFTQTQCLADLFRQGLDYRDFEGQRIVCENFSRRLTRCGDCGGQFQRDFQRRMLPQMNAFVVR